MDAVATTRYTFNTPGLLASEDGLGQMTRDRKYITFIILALVLISIAGVGFSLYSFTKLLATELRLDSWIRFGAASLAERNWARGLTNRIDSSITLSNLTRGMFTGDIERQTDPEATAFIEAYNRAIDSKPALK